MFDRVEAFVRDVRKLQSEDDLAGAITEIIADLGFKYFALTHHVDLRRTGSAIRIHNYPEGWAEWFDDHSLGVTDPVHRASNICSVGFAWSELAKMIALTRDDERVLELARAQGIGDGYTVPAHVPGEAHGSCSFACGSGERFAEEHLPSLQLVGSFSFEAARLIRRRRFAKPAVRLTDRQREVVVWAASGKSDKEIARILGISADTVGEHMRNIYRRYGVSRRTLVAVSALFDGTIGFHEVLPKR